MSPVCASDRRKRVTIKHSCIELNCSSACAAAGFNFATALLSSDKPAQERQLAAICKTNCFASKFPLPACDASLSKRSPRLIPSPRYKSRGLLDFEECPRMPTSPADCLEPERPSAVGSMDALVSITTTWPTYLVRTHATPSAKPKVASTTMETYLLLIFTLAPPRPLDVMRFRSCV